jgi:hypothetical protein
LPMAILAVARYLDLALEIGDHASAWPRRD